jgi:hypothetical protein
MSLFLVNGVAVVDGARNAIIGSGPTDPVSPVAGTIFFNTSQNVLKGWNGTAWIVLLS